LLRESEAPQAIFETVTGEIIREMGIVVVFGGKYFWRPLPIAVT